MRPASHDVFQESASLTSAGRRPPATQAAAPKTLSWRDVVSPSPDEFRRLGDQFHMDPRAIDDALEGHRRPRMQRFGEILLVVLRPARHLGVDNPVDLGDLSIFVTAHGVVTTSGSSGFTNLDGIRKHLASIGEARQRPEAALYAILDQVVDDYSPVVTGLEDVIDEIEDKLFAGDATVVRRIYDLVREVIAFQRAVHPLVDILKGLQRGAEKYDVDIDQGRILRDVCDRGLRTAERADSFRVLLQNALTVHATLVGQQQNDEMRRLSEASLAQNRETQRLSEANVAQSEETKKISSWAAILFAPTLIGTIYGMNFANMPELNWRYGYPLAVAAMLAMGAGLYFAFKRKHWL